MKRFTRSRIFIALASVLVAVAAFPSGLAAQPKKPNIIVIMNRLPADASARKLQPGCHQESNPGNDEGSRREINQRHLAAREVGLLYGGRLPRG